MRVIVAGSRTIQSFLFVANAIQESGFRITELVSGACPKGVDRLGEIYASRHDIPVRRFPADWNLGRKAGMLRNRQMAEYADALIAVWDGESRGTKNMIEEARARSLPVFIKEARRVHE